MDGMDERRCMPKEVRRPKHFAHMFDLRREHHEFSIQIITVSLCIVDVMIHELLLYSASAVCSEVR